MLLPDVKVLVYAHRCNAPDHQDYLAWLEPSINGEEDYGLADLVLSRRLAAGNVSAVAIPRI